MAQLVQVIAAWAASAYPGATISFAVTDGALANVRWDAPLPDGFTPPTQQQIDAEIAALAIPATLKRSQIMRQLSAQGLLPAAVAAVAAADQLTQQLWLSDDWHLSDLQQAPFNAMVSALGINLATFWAAAAQLAA